MFITDKNGEIIIENLRTGEYVVSEVSDSASSAYVLPADKTASVFEGAVTKVEMHNELRDTPKTGDDSNPALLACPARHFRCGRCRAGRSRIQKTQKGGGRVMELKTILAIGLVVFIVGALIFLKIRAKKK